LVSTIAIIVGIIAAAPERSSSEFVWTGYYQEVYAKPGYDNRSYVLIIGMLTTLYGMSGYEAGSQVSEETTDAQRSAPKSIVHGVIAAIIIGFAFFVGLLYSMNGRIDGALNGLTSQPVVNIFDMAFTDKEGNRILAGSLTMSILLLINVYLGGFSHMTVTSRIIFALSRDGAFPGSKYIYGVSDKLKLPVKSIIMAFVFGSLMCLLPLVNDTAFDAITGISTIGY